MHYDKAFATGRNELKNFWCLLTKGTMPVIYCDCALLMSEILFKNHIPCKMKGGVITAAQKPEDGNQSRWRKGCQQDI